MTAVDIHWLLITEPNPADQPGGREKKLLSAILLMAIKDIIDPVGLSPEEIEETKQWFRYPGNEPWTLAWICDHLNIEIQQVHKAIIERPVWLLMSKDGEQERLKRGYVKVAERHWKDRPPSSTMRPRI